MNPATQPDPRPDDPGEPRARSGWLRSIALGLLLFIIYMANHRELGTYDTEPATLIPYMLLRQGTLHIDMFRPTNLRPGEDLPPFVVERHGHLVSTYPIAPALLTVPLQAVELAHFDRTQPGWDDNLRGLHAYLRFLAKLNAALIAALVGVAIDRVLRRVGLGRWSWVVVPTAGLGSNLWVTASQAMWQHGPAALALTTSVGLLLPPAPGRARLALAGLMAGLLVALRPMDAVFALSLIGYLASNRPRGLAWFLPTSGLIVGAMIGYNLYVFGTPMGGLAVLESKHPELHNVAGPWSGDLVGGLLGTLVSPSRGLFIYWPWVALVLLALPRYWADLRPWPLVRWLLLGLLLDLLMLSKYAVWWGGHSFGPRYWTDAVPVFAILLGFALDWARRSFRPLFLGVFVTVAWSVAIQGIGAACYPSEWNTRPTNIDLDHARLWTWLDNEVSRCLIRGPQRRSYRLW